MHCYSLTTLSVAALSLVDLASSAVTGTKFPFKCSDASSCGLSCNTFQLKLSANEWLGKHPSQNLVVILSSAPSTLWTWNLNTGILTHGSDTVTFGKPSISAIRSSTPQAWAIIGAGTGLGQQALTTTRVEA